MDQVRSRLALGERIHIARRRVDARLEDVADELNVSRQLVSKWERGESVPDLIQVLRLAQFTQTPLAWFTDDLIDLRDQPEADSSCNVDVWGERPKLFDDDVFFAHAGETFDPYRKAS